MEDPIFDFDHTSSNSSMNANAYLPPTYAAPPTAYQVISNKQEEINTSRKRFTQEEDATLKSLVDKLGVKLWDEIALHMPNRTARQCRDRYNNYLFKEITHQPWTPEEDKLILEKYQEYGPHWVKIAKFLNGRSGNNIKNRWHKYLNKQMSGRPPEPTDPRPQIDLGKEIGLYSSDFSSDFFLGYNNDQNESKGNVHNYFQF